MSEAKAKIVLASLVFSDDSRVDPSSVYGEPSVYYRKATAMFHVSNQSTAKELELSFEISLEGRDESDAAALARLALHKFSQSLADQTKDWAGA